MESPGTALLGMVGEGGAALVLAALAELLPAAMGRFEVGGVETGEAAAEAEGVSLA